MNTAVQDKTQQLRLRPGSPGPPLQSPRGLMRKSGALLCVRTSDAMTLSRSTTESIDDIAHYLKLIAEELKQMNRREEAKIRSEDDVQLYIRESDGD